MFYDNAGRVGLFTFCTNCDFYDTSPTVLTQRHGIYLNTPESVSYKLWPSEDKTVVFN